jgi:dynein heavy chain 1
LVSCICSEIPVIVIAISPVVLQIIGKCLGGVDDFKALVKDTNFLNVLQAGVSRWIREIKKFDRDLSSGTALQETSFWLSVEQVLNHILRSLEVTLSDL